MGLHLADQEMNAMCKKVMSTTDDMEESLKIIIKSLGEYKTYLNDAISQETEQLVKDIRTRIDSIRKECNTRIAHTSEGIKILTQTETEGLGV